MRIQILILGFKGLRRQKEALPLWVVLSEDQQSD